MEGHADRKTDNEFQDLTQNVRQTYNAVVIDKHFEPALNIEVTRPPTNF